MEVDENSSEEGVPSSKRIVQDCDRALDSMETVFKNGGKMVEGMADRNGQRYSSNGTGSHGGKWPAKAVVSYNRWLHLLGRIARDLKLNSVVSEFRG